MCLQVRVERTPGSKRSTASRVTLAVLVFASLVGSTQAQYNCTSDSHCQFDGCNNIAQASPTLHSISGIDTDTLTHAHSYREAGKNSQKYSV